MKMLRRHVLLFQVFGDILAALPRRTVDDGAAGLIGRQVRLQHLVDVGELLASRSRDDLERQIGPLGAAVEHRQLDPDLLPEVAHDVLDDAGPGGRGQAQHGGYRPARPPSPG